MTGDNREQWISTLRECQATSEHSWGVAFFFSLFFGFVGADRLYLGYPYLGMIKLLTLGGLSWWWMFDVVLLLGGWMKDGEGKKLKRPFLDV